MNPHVVLPDLLFGLGPIEAVQDFFGLGWPLPFRILSMLGDTWGVVFAVGVAFWLFGRRPMYALVGMTVFAAGTWKLVSGLFSAARPEGGGIVVYEHLQVGAFPSGHVTQAVALWGLLYALGHVPIWVPAVVAVLTALTRLYLGAHFLGDVLGGVLYGAILVALFKPAWTAARAWLADRAFALYALFAAVALAVGLVWLANLTGGLAERRAEVVGLVIAAAIVLPVEYRWSRYAPEGDHGWRRTWMLVIGTLGLAGLVLIDRLIVPAVPPLGPVAVALAVAWVVLGAPALFRTLGWSAESEA